MMKFHLGCLFLSASATIALGDVTSGAVLEERSLAEQVASDRGAVHRLEVDVVGSLSTFETLQLEFGCEDEGAFIMLPGSLVLESGKMESCSEKTLSSHLCSFKSEQAKDPEEPKINTTMLQLAVVFRCEGSKDSQLLAYAKASSTAITEVITGEDAFSSSDPAAYFRNLNITFSDSRGDEFQGDTTTEKVFVGSCMRDTEDAGTFEYCPFEVSNEQDWIPFDMVKPLVFGSVNSTNHTDTAASMVNTSTTTGCVGQPSMEGITCMTCDVTNLNFPDDPTATDLVAAAKREQMFSDLEDPSMVSECTSFDCEARCHASNETAVAPEDSEWPGEFPEDDDSVFVVNIRYDDFPNETSWMLLAFTGSATKDDFPPVDSQWEIISEAVKTDDPKAFESVAAPRLDSVGNSAWYMFVVEDVNWDGICCDYGQGWITLTTGTSADDSVVINVPGDYGFGVSLAIWLDEAGTAEVWSLSNITAW